jgi:hypothetical protein
MRRIKPAKKVSLPKGKTAKKAIEKKTVRREKLFAPVVSSIVVDTDAGINVVTRPVPGIIPTNAVSLLTDEQLGVDSTPITDEDIKALEEYMLLADLTVNVLPQGEPGFYNIDVRIPGYNNLPIVMNHVSMCEKYGEIALKMSEAKWPLSLVFAPSKELAKNLLALLRHTKKLRKVFKVVPPPTSVPTQDALGNKVIPLKKKTPPTHSQTTMANPTYLHIDARVIPKEVKDKAPEATLSPPLQAFAEGIWAVPGMPAGIAKAAIDKLASTSTPASQLAATLDKLMEGVKAPYEGKPVCTPIPLDLSEAVKFSRLLPDESAELASLFSQSPLEKVVEPTNNFVDELLAREEDAKKEEDSITQIAREQARKNHQDFLNNWGSPTEMRETLENNIHQILMDSIMSSTQLQKVVAALYEEAICHKGGLSDLELGIDLQVTVTSPESPRAPLASVSLRNLVMD